MSDFKTVMLKKRFSAKLKNKGSGNKYSVPSSLKSRFASVKASKMVSKSSDISDMSVEQRAREEAAKQLAKSSREEYERINLTQNTSKLDSSDKDEQYSASEDGAVPTRKDNQDDQEDIGNDDYQDEPAKIKNSDEKDEFVTGMEYKMKNPDYDYATMDIKKKKKEQE